MQISVSSTLTIYHDGQFWVGIVEHVEDGGFGAARIVFGAEPSDEEVLRFVVEKWQTLSFRNDLDADPKPLAKNPKRRMRDAAKALKRPTMSTKAQRALSQEREAHKKAAAHRRSAEKEQSEDRRYAQRAAKKKLKRKGH
ncbi:YjdF family protein [Adlercreutzia sp. ZJ242]|uniref:YjdF family protein n=1 Tax=Adlercreutzia sp. ZJ242 TaxID=2709409 RepID=UPI0013EB9176|nr:YjdF family protein [Adlercreutzia sp. ZJ242]